MLARIKLTYPEIRRSVLLVDDGLLTVDNLKSLRQYVPTIEEVRDYMTCPIADILVRVTTAILTFFVPIPQIKLLRAYEGDRKTLGNAERYFIEVRMSKNL